ncbi:MAG: O-antigen ligase family protein [Candidatus Omnitrophota bacterium]
MRNSFKDRILRVIDTLAEWCVYVLIFAVTFSNSIVEIVSTIMIVAWIAGIVLRKDLKKLFFPAALILGAYFVWVLLSCFNSAYPSQSLRGIFKALQYLLIFLAVATQGWTTAKMKRFVYFAAGAVVLAGANGIVQYVTGTDLIRQRTLIPEDHLRRISSSFIHPNDFGAYLVVMASLFVSMLLLKKNTLKQSGLFLIGLIVSVACLFLTGSRGAWMFFGAAFMTVGILKGRKAAAIFIMILSAVFFLMPSETRERIYETVDFESGTAWERVMIWRGSVDMIKEHPVLGFGVNTFSKHFPDYKPEGYPDDRYAHNCYLQMASEIGIVGAVFFMMFIIAALFSSLKGILRLPDGQRKGLAIGLFGGSVGFALNSAVDTHLFSLALAVFFNIILGFTMVSSGYFKDEK